VRPLYYSTECSGPTGFGLFVAFSSLLCYDAARPPGFRIMSALGTRGGVWPHSLCLALSSAARPNATLKVQCPLSSSSLADSRSHFDLASQETDSVIPMEIRDGLEFWTGFQMEVDLEVLGFRLDEFRIFFGPIPNAGGAERSRVCNSSFNIVSLASTYTCPFQVLH